VAITHVRIPADHNVALLSLIWKAPCGRTRMTARTVTTARTATAILETTWNCSLTNGPMRSPRADIAARNLLMLEAEVDATHRGHAITDTVVADLIGHVSCVIRMSFNHRTISLRNDVGDSSR
jgi:hypothetical protein